MNHRASLTFFKWKCRNVFGLRSVWIQLWLWHVSTCFCVFVFIYVCWYIYLFSALLRWADLQWQNQESNHCRQDEGVHYQTTGWWTRWTKLNMVNIAVTQLDDILANITIVQLDNTFAHITSTHNYILPDHKMLADQEMSPPVAY